MPRRPLLVLGLDGAPPDLLFGPLLEELPTLRGIVRGGVHGRLRSCSPPLTVPAWTVMTSSKSPGRQGFFGFRNRLRGRYSDGFLATSAHVRHKRIWDYVGEAGYRVSVHGVPQTFPADPVAGAMTACFLAPDARSPGFAHPPSAAQEVLRLRPGLAVDAPAFRSGDPAKALEGIRRASEDRFDVAEFFLRRDPWDLFMLVDMGTDRIQHALWTHHDPRHPLHPGPGPHSEAIRDHYRFVDARLSRLLDLAPRDARVLVVSDHGAKRMEGAAHVNDWLRSRGLLALRREPRAPTPFSPDLVDWSRTRAWAYGGYHARVFVNLRGREPRGVVESRDYEGFLEELRETLRALPGPDGAPLPGTLVRRPEEESPGPDLDLAAAPDLHAYFADLACRATERVGNATFWSVQPEVGADGANHDWDGVFALHDPRRPAGVEVHGLRIVDVAPTVLRLFGIPAPHDLEGAPVPFEYPDATPPRGVPPEPPSSLRPPRLRATARAAPPAAHAALRTGAGRE